MPSAGDIRAGRAFVEIFADDSTVAKTLKGVESKFKLTGEFLTSWGKKLMAVGAAITAPFVAGIHSFIAASRELQAAADRMGMSVESLSALKYAAEKAGTSLEGLETSTGMMQKNIEEASSAMGEALDQYEKTIERAGRITPGARTAMRSQTIDVAEAVRMFRRQTEGSAPAAASVLRSLGLSPEALAAQNPAARLRTVAEALAATHDAGARAAAAMTLFGSDSRRVLTLVQEGAAGIDRLGRAAAAGGKLVLTLSAAEFEAADALAALKTAQDKAMASFGRLGLDPRQLKLMDTEAQLKLIAQRISQIQNVTERTATIKAIFGKGGMEIAPLLIRGEEGIVKLMDAARAKGILFTRADMEAARELRSAWGGLHAVMTRTGYELAKAIAPEFSAITERIADGVVKLNAWIGRNREAVVAVFKLGVGLTATGAALFGVGKGIEFVGKFLKPMRALLLPLLGLGVKTIGFALTPAGAAVTGLVALGAAILYVSGAGGAALDWLSDKFGALSAIAGQAWRGIADAFKKGDLTLAARIAWNALKLAWQEGTGDVQNAWAELWAAMKVSLTAAWYGFRVVILNAWQWIEDKFGTRLTGGLMASWGAFWSWFSDQVVGARLEMEKLALKLAYSYFPERLAAAPETEDKFEAQHKIIEEVNRRERAGTATPQEIKERDMLMAAWKAREAQRKGMALDESDLYLQAEANAAAERRAIQDRADKLRQDAIDRINETPDQTAKRHARDSAKLEAEQKDAVAKAEKDAADQIRRGTRSRAATIDALKKEREQLMAQAATPAAPTAQQPPKGTPTPAATEGTPKAPEPTKSAGGWGSFSPYAVLYNIGLAAIGPQERTAQAVEPIVPALKEGFGSVVNALRGLEGGPAAGAMQGVPGMASGSLSQAGSAAVDGRGRIKRDGQLAILHRGEVVLNAQQSAALLATGMALPRFESGTLPDGAWVRPAAPHREVIPDYHGSSEATPMWVINEGISRLIGLVTSIPRYYPANDRSPRTEQDRQTAAREAAYLRAHAPAAQAEATPTTLGPMPTVPVATKPSPIAPEVPWLFGPVPGPTRSAAAVRPLPKAPAEPVSLLSDATPSIPVGLGGSIPLIGPRSRLLSQTAETEQRAALARAGGNPLLAGEDRRPRTPEAIGTAIATSMTKAGGAAVAGRELLEYVRRGPTPSWAAERGQRAVAADWRLAERELAPVTAIASLANGIRQTAPAAPMAAFGSRAAPPAPPAPADRALIGEGRMDRARPQPAAGEGITKETAASLQRAIDQVAQNTRDLYNFVRNQQFSETGVNTFG